MIKFGPSGTCDKFKEMGFTATIQAAPWLKELGLDLFEYSFGRGVRVGEETARKIGAVFAENGIEMSVHAPYFINLATTDEQKAANNHEYILSSLKALRAFGGKRCVFHPGAPAGQTREQAMDVLFRRLDVLMEDVLSQGFGDLWLCPETMGKKAQLGDLDEIIEMCKRYDMLLPCIDFGHLNARDTGAIKGYDEYKRIVDRLADGLGDFKTKNMHVHFSKIQYTDKGELRHLTFADDVYGPDYEPMLEVFRDFKLEPYVACESAGTQTDDALTLKKRYLELCGDAK